MYLNVYLELSGILTFLNLRSKITLQLIFKIRMYTNRKNVHIKLLKKNVNFSVNQMTTRLNRGNIIFKVNH